jgi:hypothetical protein
MAMLCKFHNDFFIQALLHMLIAARHYGMGAHYAFCIAIACRFNLYPKRKAEKFFLYVFISKNARR